jgi:energy-coupling factor transporter ATP-binding protein EcfA2
MNNNDIFKKLRVALQLRDDQIIEILNLVNFRVSKGELANVFRSEDHPNFMECGDQLLRNFLNGLVIHLRGTKEDPKNPKEVLDQIAKNKAPLYKEDKKPDFKKEGEKFLMTNKLKQKDTRQKESTERREKKEEALF